MFDDVDYQTGFTMFCVVMVGGLALETSVLDLRINPYCLRSIST